ncbi:MAG: DUF47 family protein [Bacteroidetes bacterium]|nr:DUF47 family protein [Bacteroidota bacterium]MCL5027339.1 DUF47 family protein [Chloroflexota bacterium]
MPFRRMLQPRRTDFLKLLLDQAQKTLDGMRAFESFTNTDDPAMAQRVTDLEREEDELRLILIDELNRTFVTPIDREDIFALSRAIDDILDYAYTTIDEMTLLKIHPTPRLQQMAGILSRAAEEIYYAVLQLKSHPSVAAEHAARAKSLENQAESMYRGALVELFESVRSVEDVVNILKMREVYRHLSNAADRGDEAANIIGDIVVKTQ